jgi:hypothetical protein
MRRWEGAAPSAPCSTRLETSATSQPWRSSQALDVSLTGVYGWLQGGDQYGVLIGLSPKFRLWDTD